MAAGSFDRKGQVALLTQIGKAIAGKEAELQALRQTQIKVIKQYERSKYVDEIERLRALVEQVEGDL
jgi:hypothetical protein